MNYSLLPIFPSFHFSNYAAAATVCGKRTSLEQKVTKATKKSARRSVARFFRFPSFDRPFRSPKLSSSSSLPLLSSVSERCRRSLGGVRSPPFFQIAVNADSFERQPCTLQSDEPNVLFAERTTTMRQFE